MARNTYSASRRLALSVFGATLAAATLAGGGCSSDEAPAPPEPAASADAWRHVYLRVPPARYDEFEEGGGLIRRLDAAEAPEGGGDWWLAYLPPSELARLGASGLAWQDPPPARLKPQAMGGPACVTPAPGSVVDRFCPYRDDSYVASCKRSIMDELTQANTDYPPVNGVPYAQSFGIGSTFLARRLFAVRVGRIWKSGDPAVPQLVIYAGQHAREWAGPEAVMRLFRYFASSYRDDTNGVRELLQKVAIVFVPVMNPDGYDFTHLDAGKRLWRTNRQPCPGDNDGNPDNNGGIDPNRNFHATFGQPNTSSACSFNTLGSSYPGPSAGTAQETLPLLRVMANDGFAGKYRTRFSLNVHSYGNFVLFPEGLSSDFSVCTTNTNCTAPDLGALHDLVGTELTTPLNDEESGKAYVTGQTYRQLYKVAGDSVASAVYGTPSRPNDPRVLSSTIEITHTECGFKAEDIPPAQFDALYERVHTLGAWLAYRLPDIDSGAAFPDFQLPHLHRRQPAGNAREYPTLRVAALASLGDVDIAEAGETKQDDVRDGVLYRMWRHRSPEPDHYVFPTEFTVCAKESCETVELDEAGEKVDLCDPARFPDAGAGWKFQPDAPGGPQEECFWKHDGSGPSALTSGKRSLAKMKQARLVYSYRWQNAGGSKMTVYVSDNGFADCSEKVGTGCRVVRDYPYGDSHYEFRDGAYRTEIVDVSEFDHAESVQIRFDVTGASPGVAVDVFDPIFVGWKG